MATTQRRLSAAARRDELLNAAARLALDAGDTAAASLERVAEAAGCSRNLAYRYFPNHAALLQALGDREGRAVREHFSLVPGEGTFDRWFKGLVTAYLDLPDERRRLLYMLLEQSMFPGRSQRQGALITAMARKMTTSGVLADRAAIAAPILASSLLGAAGVVAAGTASRSEVAAQLRRVATTLIA